MKVKTNLKAGYKTSAPGPEQEMCCEPCSSGH